MILVAHWVWALIAIMMGVSALLECCLHRALGEGGDGEGKRQRPSLSHRPTVMFGAGEQQAAAMIQRRWRDLRERACSAESQTSGDTLHRNGHVYNCENINLFDDGALNQSIGAYLKHGSRRSR